jgi:hypothetical protein
MSLTEITVQGTLNPDGTLELDHKPNLLPRRVAVVLRQQPLPTPTNEDWFQHLQRIRAEREAAGYPFMNEEETTTHVEWLREGDGDACGGRNSGVQRSDPPGVPSHQR